MELGCLRQRLNKEGGGINMNFLEYNSWYDQQFADKSTLRHWTFRIALNLLYQQPNHNIVETGTIRQLNDFGAGYSTFIFGTFIERYGGHITTIDISEQNMKVCMDVTKDFKDKVTYHIADSLFALTLLKEPIDLLYLDSLDTPMGDNEDASLAQKHCLKEFKIVEHLLHDKSIVLIDDNNFANGGKSRFIKKYLAEKGWRVLLNAQQSIWIK